MLSVYVSHPVALILCIVTLVLFQGSFGLPARPKFTSTSLESKWSKHICNENVEVFSTCNFEDSPRYVLKKSPGVTIHKLTDQPKGFRVPEGCKVTLYTSTSATVSENNKAILITKKGDICAQKYFDKEVIKAVGIEDDADQKIAADAIQKMREDINRQNEEIHREGNELSTLREETEVTTNIMCDAMKHEKVKIPKNTSKLTKASTLSKNKLKNLTNTELRNYKYEQLCESHTAPLCFSELHRKQQKSSNYLVHCLCISSYNRVIVGSNEKSSAATYFCVKKKSSNLSLVLQFNTKELHTELESQRKIIDSLKTHSNHYDADAHHDKFMEILENRVSKDEPGTVLPKISNHREFKDTLNNLFGRQESKLNHFFRRHLHRRRLLSRRRILRKNSWDVIKAAKKGWKKVRKAFGDAAQTVERFVCSGALCK